MKLLIRVKDLRPALSAYPGGVLLTIKLTPSPSVEYSLQTCFSCCAVGPQALTNNNSRVPVFPDVGDGSGKVAGSRVADGRVCATDSRTERHGGGLCCGLELRSLWWAGVTTLGHLLVPEVVQSRPQE